MEDHGRRALEDTKETIRQIWEQIGLISAAIVETRQRIEESRQLLAQAPRNYRIPLPPTG
jgi:hypothetical protein